MCLDSALIPGFTYLVGVLGCAGACCCRTMILCAWCYLSGARIVSVLEWTGGKRMIVLLVHTLVALTPSPSSISFIALFSEDEKDPTLFLACDEL